MILFFIRPIVFPRFFNVDSFEWAWLPTIGHADLCDLIDRWMWFVHYIHTHSFCHFLDYTIVYCTVHLWSIHVESMRLLVESIYMKFMVRGFRIQYNTIQYNTIQYNNHLVERSLIETPLRERPYSSLAASLNKKEEILKII